MTKLSLVLAPAVALCLILPALAVGESAQSENQPPRPTADETPTEAAASPAKPTVELYGFFKLDGSYDDSTVDAGNFARWVSSPSIIEPHDHFNMTARQTRLGLRVSHGRDGGLVMRGRLEIDFYGGGAENKNQPMLRHGYAELEWPDRGLNLKAGQTSDLISPLVPTTINYPVAWWAGNIGYRRPQLRLTKTVETSETSSFVMAAAISRSIGDDFGRLEPGDSGADSGLPTFQVALSRKFSIAGRPAGLGISGHWGKEELRERLGDPVPEFDSWSLNLDYSLPIYDRVSLKGELWAGEDLDDYLGGIGQGINRVSGDSVGATGGWIAVESKPGPRSFLGIGLSLDNPDDEDLLSGARAENGSIWVNYLYDVRKYLRTGVEISHWSTDYIDLEDDSALRFQGALIYSF